MKYKDNDILCNKILACLSSCEWLSVRLRVWEKKVSMSWFNGLHLATVIECVR